MSKMFSEKPKDLQLLLSYTTKIGIDSKANKLSEKMGKELFNVIVKDYKDGLISVDELSALCELMYDKFDFSSETYTLLSNGAEIEWYIRNEPKIASDFIEDILNFFK